MNKTELLNKLARDNGERLLLARALDKLELARQRNIPACTGFLSPQERVSVENLLNACGHPRHLFFGGYEGAERTVCAFLPDWQEAEDWQGDGESCPVRALRCTWSGGQKLTHRDFLGSILGLGLDREKVGDLETEMVREFFYAVSYGAAMNLHIRQMSGANNHHIIEAAFKAFARALDAACAMDPRVSGVLSTKGAL